MATVAQEIQAKIDAIKAKAAEEVAALEAELAAGGSHLAQELHALEAWAKNLVIRIHDMVAPPAPSQDRAAADPTQPAA